jgi:hypothetical protein
VSCYHNIIIRFLGCTMSGGKLGADSRCAGLAPIRISCVQNTVIDEGDHDVDGQSRRMTR